MSIANEPQRFTRRPHADLDFRTDRHPLHVLAELVDQERIPFVSTVEADLLPEEARGDPHTDQAQRIPRPAAVTIISTSPSGATSPDRIVVRDGRFEELKNASYSRSTSGRYFKSVT